MTPSTESKSMTEGQITKAVTTYRALLEKHAREFSAEAVQMALGQPELADEQLAVFRRRVEVASQMVIREVEVDYDIPLQEAISATKRVEYLNNEVVNSAPCNGKGKKKVQVCFFPLRAFKTVKEFDELMESLGLQPDPHAQCKVNEADPDFAVNHPNGVQWQDANGKHCYLSFRWWLGERDVHCDRVEGDWYGRWWVGGVRKQSSGA